MEESIILTFWECITHFSTLSLPFQLMIPVCILAGVFAGVRLEQKWYLFAGILVLLVLACEGVCRFDAISAVFLEFDLTKEIGIVMPGNSTRLRVANIGKSSHVGSALKDVVSMSICPIDTIEWLSSLLLLIIADVI